MFFTFLNCTNVTKSGKDLCKLPSKHITPIPKLLYEKVLENTIQKIVFGYKLKRFLVIQNDKPVTGSINKLSSRKKSMDFSTSDLSTVYIKIFHEKP